MAEPPVFPPLLNPTKDSPGVMYDEYGRPYVLVKRKVKRRRRGDSQSAYEQASFLGQPSNFTTDYPYPTQTEHRPSTGPRLATVPSPERRQSPDQNLPPAERRESPGQAVPSSGRIPSTGKSQRSSTAGQYNYEDMVTGHKTIRAQSIQGSTQRPTDSSAAMRQIPGQNVVYVSSPGAKNLQGTSGVNYVYVHKNNVHCMPTDDEFTSAKLKLYDKIGYQNLDQRQKIAFLKMKHAENTWVRGGPAMEYEQPPHHIDNFCYRLSRPYLGSPKTSIVKEKIFDPIEDEKPSPISYMRDYPKARGSTYSGHIYEYADSRTVPQGRVSISLRNGPEIRPVYTEPSDQMTYTHEYPGEYPPFYNRAGYTEPPAQQIVAGSDRAPVYIRAGSHHSSKGNVIVVNCQPCQPCQHDNQPQTPQHPPQPSTSPRHSTHRDSAGFRTPPTSMSRTKVEKINETNSGEITAGEGIWDQLEKYEPTEQMARNPTKAAAEPEVTGFEVINVKSSGNSSHGSFANKQRNSSSMGGRQQKEASHTSGSSASFHRRQEEERRMEENAHLVVQNALTEARSQIQSEYDSYDNGVLIHTDVTDQPSTTVDYTEETQRYMTETEVTSD